MGAGGRYCLLLACYLLFLLLAAAVFVGIEGPPERRLRTQLQGDLASFREAYGGCLPPGKLEGLLDAALKAEGYGISALGNVSDAENWDFPSSLFFVVSVLTTTGYGHTSPLSDGGKAFCVGYAALGLPVGLVVLAMVRGLLLPPPPSRPMAWAAARWGLGPRRAALLQAGLLGLLVVAAFLLLPALLLWGLEGDWSLLESLYFCFVSLSTIGLGDFVPGKGRHPALRGLFQLGLVCYLLLGLLAMLLALEAISQLQEVQAIVSFFSPQRPPLEEDRGDILARDELTLSIPPRPVPSLEPIPAQEAQGFPPGPGASGKG
ncbi:LOW QUALITY PROTEIN: potassium channel subfamily K member 7 [Tachyglossus aculeatus]|uniref:LOW QUALITY PROTEIN: potassium channel subfamily K member 7 n=1 Tax=Tachyglossus aculeatus TaxID=9261 RepID=UPI0018F28430|nr:LOW QUALITY PROTEIN: potassium channel subfamily K member 7 [Tachyglossus aculeatus]